MAFQANAQTSKQQHVTSETLLIGLSEQQKLKELISLNQGTYQLRVSNVNYAPLLTYALLETVLASRQQDTNTILQIDEYTKLYIPSTTSILSETFVPLETIVYTTDPIGTTITD